MESILYTDNIIKDKNGGFTMKEKKLGFGLMRLPVTDPNDAGKIDIELTKKMVDTFLERGFTYFDTAWMYCNFQSENAVKEAIVNRHPRDSFTIATKLHSAFIETKEDRDKVFNKQLEKTGAGFFDYYLLHDIGVEHYKKFKELDCFNWIRDKKEKGLVKKIGFSFHDSADFLEKVLNEYPWFDFVQLQINYLDWDSHGIQSRKCYETATRHGLPIIAMEPVKGGTLANPPEEVKKIFERHSPGMSPSSWAIRFAASLDNVFMVLSAQLLDNTGYMMNFKPLSEEEKKIVGEAVDKINSSIEIPCTGCSYCTDGCPMKIAIPKYFSLYNADKKEIKEKGWTPQAEYYDNLTKSFGKASDCIECGQCESACPQHLPIIKYLKNVAKYFGK